MKKVSANSFRKLLYNRKVTIPFSIIMAFIMWLSITMGQQTTMERTFSVNKLSVNLANTAVKENGMSVIGDISHYNFSVKVKGSSSAVSKLNSDDIKLYVSAAEVDSPGDALLTVYASHNSSDAYEVVEINPSQITINFDYVDTKTFEIVPQTDGITVTEADLVKGTEAIGGLESNTIEITGPRSILSRIEKVAAVVKENKDIKSKETFDAQIYVYDIDMQELPKENLVMSINNVKVTVPVYKQKTVPVKVAFSNLPDGFDLGSLEYELDHNEVLIEGIPEDVEKVEEITLMPIDIRTLSRNSNNFSILPKLPDGIRISDDIESFEVTFDTDYYSEKTISVDTMKYEGKPSNLKVTAANNISKVKICAPRNVINRINSNNTYAKIDLTDKKAGKYIVSVSICFKDYDNVWAVGNYQTTITLK